jgi:hypothetical protein
MTGIAVGGENRTDVAVEIHFAGGEGRCGGEEEQEGGLIVW